MSLKRSLLYLLLALSCQLMTQAAADDAATDPPAEDSETDNKTNSDDDLVEIDTDSKRRFRVLPIPIVITEPAIGDGLGLAVALFHPVKEGKTTEPRVATPDSMAEMPEARAAPPVVTAVVGAYTRTDTWLAGMGHFNNWRNDSIRYAGALATAKINSMIYLLNRPLDFSMETNFIYQDLKFRLGQSDFMLGTGFVYMDADNQFGPGVVQPEYDDRFAVDFKNVGLAAKLSFDSRDNSTNPTSGQLMELSLMRYDESFGGSFNYWAWKTKALAFRPLADKFTLGFRVELSGVVDRPPFFAYPYVKLRGIPALRYQDKIAGAAEVEGRYLLAPRWEVSAFAGIGYTGGDISLFDNPNGLYNFGAGARYKVFDAHNVWMGIDIARGPEEWNWYVQVGQAW